MYPISSTVKALFEAEQKKVLRITGTDKNGATISITDANLIMGSFEIDRFCSAGEKIEIGNAIASELKLELDNRQNQFNGIVFEGAELFVEIGIADWTLNNPTVSWIPCGYFTCDEQPRTLSIITIHALDRMMRFDAVPPTKMPWTDNNGNTMLDNNGNILYLMTGVKFPCTVAQIVASCCELCDVPFAQDLSGFPSYDFVLSSLPVVQQEISYRNLIQWCAGIMGTNAWIDWNGNLRFSWYDNATDYVMTTVNRFNSDLQENDITLTGVTYTNAQNIKLVSGSPDYALDMTGNYLAAAGVAQIVSAVKDAIEGFTYRPFRASVINAPYLWPMDVVTFTDGSGVNHTSILTNVNFDLNGFTELEGRGLNAKTNKETQPSGMTTEQAFFVNQVHEATENLDKSLDQQGIFDRLTNNGEAQGIYMKDGQLYVNMSFARSGTLILGGLDNRNGYLEVQDSTGRAIGTWGKDGINIFQGEISGPNITIGGLDNRNGIIQILDENGDMVGQIDGTGMFLTNSDETVKLNNEALAFYSNGVYLGAIIRNNRTAGISLVSGADSVFEVAGNQAYIGARELYVRASPEDLPEQAYTGPITIETPAGTHYLNFINGILVTS